MIANPRYFGVSTAALMPDEMDTDLSRQESEEDKNARARAMLDAMECKPAGITVKELRRSNDWAEACKCKDINQDANYQVLQDVLNRAYEQAASGKGAQRHGQDLPFSEQPMQTISRLIGSHDGLIYQAIKKAQESQRMAPDAAVRELLGAIVYLAGAVIFMEAKDGQR